MAQTEFERELKILGKEKPETGQIGASKLAPRLWPGEKIQAFIPHFL